MANSTDKLAKELKKQMIASDERKPKPYDTQAEVLRVEDGVAWVHIPGGVDETPVRLTINAKKGDNVNLHVANGTAWITGNSTNPPTDDSTANYAVNISNEVKKDVTVLNTVVAENIEATNARFTNVEADTAKIHDLTADNLHATVGYIEDLTADNITAQDISASSGYIKDLEAESITAQDITADHATVGSLDANYAHITDGVIDNAKIGYADVNNLSTNYAQINLANVNNAWIENGVVKEAAISDAQIIGVSANKLTAGTIDASNITVTNLNASNITTGSITVDGITIDVENNEASIDGSYIEDGTITMNGFAQEVKDVIDGAIETFTGTVVPTLNNAPANAWTTTKLKDQHIGDVYYVVNASSKQNGYCYRFSKSGSTYSWQLIKDSDVTAALQRLQTAEGKISNIESFDEEMATFKTETEGEISTLQTKTTSLETSLGDKVDKTVFNEVKQTVDGNSASITELSTITTNNGLTKTTNITNTVNTVSQTATGNSSKISSLTTTLGTNADGTTKAGDIVHRTSAVEQDLSGFKTTVSKTYHKTSDFNTYKAANDTAVAAAKKAGDDAQADLDEYKGTVSETYATKSSLTQTAEGIRTDVSGTYETKTDASAKLTEAKGDATTKANKALTDAKADTTNKLKSYYTKTETDSAITQKAGEISLSVAQTEISKIEVGGRNLLSNSQTITKTWPKENATVSDGVATVTCVSSGSARIYQQPNNGYWTWQANQDYTVSVDAKASASGLTFYFNAVGLSKTSDDITLTTDWKRYMWTISATSVSSENGSMSFIVRSGQSGTVQFRNLKLEYGNKATDWTPAPEDLENYADGAVATAKAEIKVTTDSISTEVSKKVGNNEVISKINQSPEEITIDASRVNIAGAAIFSNYATTAQLNSEVNARKAVYATSSTAAGTKAKVADCSNFALYTGASVAVTFSNANTHATPTLNVNGTGAKNIKGYTGAALTEAEYKWIANSTVTFTYDGTNWRMQDGGALQAKAAAAASASTASTKASEASTSATNAATSASTASSKASEASTSATNAASSASTASSKASSASTSATNAATSASTASTKASEASTSATNAATSASTASTKASEAATSATAAAEVMGGFTILWNYENFSTANNGEGYICAFDPKTGSKSDANGWVKWNGTKRTISKQMINPNTILPYNIPIYVVCRLSSATATTGTNYLVWYKSGWKYAALPTPKAVGGDWTWTEATDIILGKFAEPSSEEAFTDCEIYNPPRSSKHITTNTVTAGSAQATANAAAPKSSAVAEEQYIYISKASGTTSVSGTTTWITETGDKQNTWTTKRPTYNSSYPVLFVAKQKKVVSGTVTCTTPIKDDTTTIIDGGHITTGTIDTNRLNADTIKSNIVQTTDLNASKITAGTLDAARIGAGSIAIGKLDSSTQTKVNNGDSALSKVNYYNRACQVGNSSNTQTNLWRKFASYTEVGRYTDAYIIFDVSNNGDFGANKKFGRLKAHFRTDETAGAVSTSLTKLEWITRGEGISLSDFVLAYKATSGTDVKVELWARCPSSYAGYRFGMVEEGKRGVIQTTQLWTLYDDWTANGVASITSGYTQVVSTDIDAARTTATNYIYADSSGIRIASASPSTQKQRMQLTSSEAALYSSDDVKRVSITSSTGVVVGRSDKGHTTIYDNGLHVWVGTETNPANKIASFGGAVTIGQDKSTRIHMTNNMIQAIDANGNPYFSIANSNGRSQNYKAEVLGEEIYTTSAETFTLTNHSIWSSIPANTNFYIVTDYYAATNELGWFATKYNTVTDTYKKGTKKSNTYSSYNARAQTITTTTAKPTVPSGQYYTYKTVEIRYQTSVVRPFYSFGEDVATTGGANSFVIGEGTIANSTNALAIGTYNADSGDDIFMIGCGTSNTSRKNIVSVGRVRNTQESHIHIDENVGITIGDEPIDDFVIMAGTNYRMWNSGISECWVSTTKNVALNGAYGSLYTGNWAWTFPSDVVFIENPTVICSQFKWGTGASWGTVSGVTTTNATLRGLDAFSRASGSCAITAYAIGRWK